MPSMRPHDGYITRALSATWVPHPVYGTTSISLLEHPLILSHLRFFVEIIIAYTEHF